MAHRESIKEYLGKVDISERRVVDWGRGTKPITKYCKGTPKSYFGIDKLDHVGADLVVDLDNDIVSDSAVPPHNVAFCMETLEHVRFPDKVVKRIFTFLENGGTFYFSVPFLYPIHSEEDYWRYTDQGMEELLERNGFTVVEIKPTEDNMGWVGCAVKKYGTA